MVVTTVTYCLNILKGLGKILIHFPYIVIKEETDLLLTQVLLRPET